MKRLVIFSLVAVASASAVDVNVVEDEVKKAEELALSPEEGLGYYDTQALAELALARARRSPTGAMWRSLVLPGWGQIYNRQYLKAPIIIAAEAASLSLAVDNYLTTRRLRREADAQTNPRKRIDILDRRETFIVETEFWGWLFVGFIAYSMMDAYVDAHLAAWEVEDLPGDKGATSRLRVFPTLSGLNVSVELF
jgi:hypothetical protein